VKLADQQLASGRSLFRWRSYVPLLFLPAFALAFVDYQPWFATARARLAWQLVCVAVAAAGLLVRVKVVGHAPFGTSGRNQAEQRAESLTTTGLYSVVRHPLYLGNALMFAGLAMVPGVWYLPVIVVLGTALYYERIMLVEEAFLEEKYGDAFRRWAAATPAVWPAPRRWTAPALPFAWRMALRAESYAAFTIVVVVFALDLVQSGVLDGTWRPHPVWSAASVGMGVLWVGARFARKYTRLLTVDGR
jgi:protein-S-isoprenylcysteine O-methyltransferase Ste14